MMLDLAIGGFKLRGGNIENALIVLPEGFNIGRSYYGKERPNTEWSILGRLAQLCLEHKCVFVASVIVDDGSNVQPPYSSAYLVDGNHRPFLLCRKCSSDNAELSNAQGQWWTANYTTCGSFQSTAISYRGVALSALICMDAQAEHRGLENCQALAQEMFSHNAQFNILCIPANMKEGFCNGAIGMNVGQTTPWQNTIQVLANSHSSGPLGSFVSKADGTIISPTARGCEYKIETVGLDA